MSRGSDSQFGIRLRVAFKGATNAEIQQKLGASSKSTVSNYMKGRIPDGETLIRIAQIANCDLHWLLTGEGEPSRDPLHLLPDNVRTLLVQQAETFDKPVEQFVVEIIEEGLVDRGMRIMKRYPDLEPAELRLMPYLFALFDTSEIPEENPEEEDVTVSSSEQVSRKLAG